MKTSFYVIKLTAGNIHVLAIGNNKLNVDNPKVGSNCSSTTQRFVINLHFSKFSNEC